MKLHEKNLKKIIKVIEKYAVINKIEILNSEVSVCVPKENKVIGIDLNKPLQFSMTFTLGEKKEKLPIKIKNENIRKKVI